MVLGEEGAGEDSVGVGAIWEESCSRREEALVDWVAASCWEYTGSAEGEEGVSGVEVVAAARG